MTTLSVPVERVSFVSSRPFAAVLSAVEAAVGQPDLKALLGAISTAPDYAEVRRLVDAAVGPTGLMLFMRFNLGEVIGKGVASPARGSVRLLIGNPVTMRSMAEHVADAGSYAPITVLIDERPDGVHLSYDRIASQLAPYGDLAALTIAQELDRNVETILRNAAG